MTGTDASSELLYVALADDLARQIESGTYRPADRLPSIRKLRAERGCSIATVSHALLELERRGLVEARPRSGYYVRATDPVPAAPGITRHAMRPREVPLALLADDFVTASADPALVPLGGAVLSEALLPIKALSRIAKSLVGPDAFARYGAPAGSEALRRAVAKRSIGMGLAASHDEVVITSGCMDAIRLALQAVAAPGDVVALESPTFFGFLQLVRDLGYQALEVPSDPRTGIDLDSLERALGRHTVRALIVTPSHQNPTGAQMPDDARRALVELTARRGVTIIEDDVYGDLQLDGPRPRPLASYGGDVLYCSSVSKTLTPGVRIGWLIPSEQHLARVTRLKLSGTITSPPLNQAIVARFLDGGGYERHLRRLRAALKRQLAACQRALAQHLPPGSRMTSPAGGFLLWVRFPEGTDTYAPYPRLRRRGVSYLPGALTAIDPDRYRDCVRLSCGYPWSDGLEDGVRTLCRSLRRSR